MVPRHPLLEARERAQFSLDEMAFLVDLSPLELSAMERGETYAPPQVIERYATSLGLSVRELLAGEEPTAVALLFRRMSRESGPFAEAVDAGLAESLGRFVRVARDIARLRALLGENPSADQLSWLDHFKPRPVVPRAENRQEFYEQIVALASGVRKFLGLSDTEEIVSMVELCGRLGIITRFVDPDGLDTRIDGASLLDPQPAILVNLLGGGEKWWHTRMTLAHELCHLCFDRAALDPAHPRKFFVFSPHRPQARSPKQRFSWRLFEHFEDLEARANAFAGEFLAPTAGVRKLIDPHEASSSSAVERLCDRYKIGVETAINRLTNSFALSEEQRQQMLARPPPTKPLATHPDRVRSNAQLLHDDYFVGLVMRALSSSKIRSLEARSLLGLRLSERLPAYDAVSVTQQAPLRAADDPARKAAGDYLSRHFGLEYFIQSVERTQDGWRVSVCRRHQDGQFEMAGELLFGPDLAIRTDSPLLVANS